MGTEKANVDKLMTLFSVCSILLYNFYDILLEFYNILDYDLILFRTI
jgi:hypothetical protein